VGILIDDIEARVDRSLNDFSTPIILNGQPAGSGTFIKSDGIFGILTARHVIHNPKDRSRTFDFSITSDQQLGLSLINHRGHSFILPMCVLSAVDVGPVVKDDAGPDISVIVLPEANVGSIAARKSFIDISILTEERIDKCSSANGVWYVAGFPQFYQRVSEFQPGPVRSTYIPMLTLRSEIRQWSQKDGFDYLQFGIDALKLVHTTERLGDVTTPNTFGGLSGGGVWKIPTKSSPNGGAPLLLPGEALLAGVAFYEIRNEKGMLKELRCHGPRSIYMEVRDALLRSRR
jgi:hypothetical protein